jgi:hypothetical protein
MHPDETGNLEQKASKGDGMNPFWKASAELTEGSLDGMS